MNIPTKITVSRIVLIVLMLVGLMVLSFIPNLSVPFIFGDGRWAGINIVYLVLFFIFIIASFTDYLDGHLARKWNQVTSLGKFLDPIADKLLINSLVIFLIVPASYAQGQMSFSIWCAILLVARDIVVDALRFIAAQKGVVIAANIFGKMKTVFQMVAVSFVLLNDFPFAFLDWGWPVGLRITDWLIYLATAMSVISGVIYVWQNRAALKEEK